MVFSGILQGWLMMRAGILAGASKDLLSLASGAEFYLLFIYCFHFDDLIVENDQSIDYC